MSSEWPLGERMHVSAQPLRAQRRLPRAAWLLAGAAFLLGALFSAAVFAIGWHRQAQVSSSTQAALAAATARNQRLASSLAAERERAAQARRAETAATAAAAKVTREASRLASALAATGKSADSVSLGASALGSGLDKLAGELRTLTVYLSSTPTGQLDPGYVATQSAYLAKQLDRLRAERGDLAAAIAAFDSGAKALADRASVLSGRVH
jgi:hypothetical protein